MLTLPLGSMVFSKAPRKIMVDRFPPFPPFSPLGAILSGPSGVSRNFDPSEGKKTSWDEKTGNGVCAGSAARGITRDKASEEAVSRVLCVATERVAAGRSFLYGGRCPPALSDLNPRAPGGP